MPDISASQLIGKTITLKSATNFYRVNDINNVGDKAKMISNRLPAGYQLTVDSFILKGPQSVDAYGFIKAKRSDDYLTFYGRDKNYYAVKVKDLNIGKEELKKRDIKTVKQEQEERKLAQMTDIEKLAYNVGKYAKWLVLGVAVVWATGYLIKSTKK